MGDTINSDVIKKTQNLLGKFIKKPPLNEKLLKKPPFRFLHDIVNVVIKENGFLTDLYTDEELISENIKDRNAKIHFLQKLIDVLKIVTGDKITARPSKIVAGQEPEKTNELLQAIGVALEKKLSSKDAVATVISFSAQPKVTNASHKKTFPNTKVVNDGDKVKKNDAIKDNSKRIIDNTIKVRDRNKNDKIKEKSPGSNGIIINNNNKQVNKLKGATSVTKNKTNVKTNELVVNRRNSENKIKEFEPTIIKTEALVSNKTTDENESNIQQNAEISIDTEVLQSKNEQPTEMFQTEIETLEKVEETTQPVIDANEVVITKQDEQKELIDVIDQEAERRRSERRSEKRALRQRQRVQQNAEETDKDASSLEPDIGKSPKKKELSRLKHQTSREKILKAGDEFGNQISLDKNPLNSELVHQNAEDKGDSVESLESTKPTDLSKRSYIRQEEIGDTVVPRPRTSLRPPSVRPASARPGAPRRRDKNIEIILQPEETIKLGEINVKVETFNGELDDDGENLIIIEDPMVQDNFGQSITGEMLEGGGEGMVDIDAINQQGHLVQQILETQKEFSINNENDDYKKTINDEEWDSMTKRQRESSGKQMDTLRDSIQKLTRSINPLGKLMDFIQEDTDSMQREIVMWRDVYQHTNTELLKERSLTESAIEPLKNQLLQIDNSIKDYIEMINTSRTNIIQNDEKINKLLLEM